MKIFQKALLLFCFFASTVQVCKGCEVFNKDEGRSAFLQSIESTKGPVVVGAFKLLSFLPPNADILNALKTRSQRGLDTRVILEKRLTRAETHSHDNQCVSFSHKCFEETGADLRYVLEFANVHTKVIASPTFAFVGTTNFDDNNENMDIRDFTVKISHQPLAKIFFKTVTQLVEGKHVEWAQLNFDVLALADESTMLSWGPYFHKKHLLDMIDCARTSIKIYQQDIQDRELCGALVDRAQRGISLQVLMSKDPFGKNVSNKNLLNLKKIAEAGGHVRLTGQAIEGKKPVHVHAKVMLIDDQLMYLGSANFYPAVLSKEGNNLNVGVITNEDIPVHSVVSTFDDDWRDHSMYALSHTVLV